MKKNRAILFDYGGTLDTGGDHWGCVFWDVYSRLLPSVGYEQYRKIYVETERWLGKEPIISQQTTFKEILHIKTKHHFALLNSDKTGSEPLLSEDQRLSAVEALYDRVKRETSRSREVIEQLQGKRTIALVSNFYGNLTTVLQEFGLDSLFQTVVESAKVGMRKPDKRIFEYALQRIGCESQETIVVGDSMKNDILPAKAIGCQTIWIEGQAWNSQEIDRSKADQTIKDIEELLTVDIINNER